MAGPEDPRSQCAPPGRRHAQERNDGNDTSPSTARPPISPYCPAANRLIPPITTTITRATTHWGTSGNQPTKNFAAPVTSKPETMMSMTQIEPPDRKAGPPADPGLGEDEKEPVVGSDDASSASASMTDTTDDGSDRVGHEDRGTCWAIADPVPRKKPAPIARPRAIMDRCHVLKRLRSEAGTAAGDEDAGVNSGVTPPY